VRVAARMAAVVFDLADELAIDLEPVGRQVLEVAQ
jgi:hypothetical protein